MTAACADGVIETLELLIVLRRRIHSKKPQAVAQGGAEPEVCCQASTPAGSDVPECRADAVAGDPALLLVALARLELAFDLFAVDGVAPLLPARAAVEHEIRRDLVTVAVFTGGQEGKQVPAQVGQAQLFVQLLLLAGQSPNSPKLLQQPRVARSAHRWNQS